MALNRVRSFKASKIQNCVFVDLHPLIKTLLSLQSEGKKWKMYLFKDYVTALQ